MTELTLSTGKRVELRTAPGKTFEGHRLPGAFLRTAMEDGRRISLHQYTDPSFQLELRSFGEGKEQAFDINESCPFIKLEVVLHGSMRVKYTNGDERKLQAGQYQLVTHHQQRIIVPPKGCTNLICFLAPPLLQQIHLGQTIETSRPRLISLPMHETIMKMLQNPYEERFRKGFYDYSLRELLFHLITSAEFEQGGKLSPTEIAAVYAADNIIAENLARHYNIHELAKLVNSNPHTLKNGFAEVFHKGVFERLIDRKMERATILLETSNLLIRDIAEEAGYDTVTGFIHAFRKKFGQSPKDWRKSRRPTGE